MSLFPKPEKMLQTIFEVIRKDLRLLIRSRSSLLIILLTPLLILLITGVSLEKQTNFYITAGVYSDSYSHLAKSYISNLEMQSVNVKYFDSEKECVDAVKYGTVQACIVFSPDLRIEDKYNGFIKFYVDYSHLNLAWAIKDMLFTTAQEETKELSQNLIDDLLSVVETANKNLDLQKSDLTNLATSNDKLSSIFSTISSYLSVINPKFDFSLLKLDDIEDSASSLKLKSSGVVSLASNKLSEVSNSLDELKSSVSQINDSQVNSLILPKIDKIKTDIISYQQTILANKNSIDSTAGELQSYIENLKNQINNLSKILDEVRISQDKSLEYVSDGKKQVANILNSVFDLQKSINELEKKIDQVSVFSSGKIAEPFKTEIESVTPEKHSITLLFPTILSLMVLFVSLIISSTLLQMEKQSEAHIRNLITPTKTLIISLGIFLTTLIVVILQYSISLITVAPMLSIKGFFLKFLEALLLTILSSSVFIFIGILIGSSSKSEEISLILTVLVALLLIIFSGMIYPLEAFPRGLQMVLKLNPLYLTDYFYNQIFVKDVVLTKIPLQILTQLCWFVGLFIALVLLQELFDEKFLISHRNKALHKKKKRNSRVENEETEKLTKLLVELNHILSPKNKITTEEIENAKRLYLKALSIYQKLDKTQKEEFFDELNLIHKKLSAL